MLDVEDQTDISERIGLDTDSSRNEEVRDLRIHEFVGNGKLVMTLDRKAGLRVPYGA